MKKKQLIVLFIFIGINLILLLLIYRINNYNRILIDELVQKKVDEKLKEKEHYPFSKKIMNLIILTF